MFGAAVVFLCEIDNMAWHIMLSGWVRSRVEEFGRLEMQEGEAAILARSKVAHVCIIVLHVLLITRVPFGPMIFVWLPFWLGGIVGAILPGDGAAATCARIGKMTISMTLGTAFAGLLFVVAGTLHQGSLPWTEDV